jgi:leucine dehydrogenase
METIEGLQKGIIMNQKSPRRHTELDGLFRYANFLNYGDVHFKFDRATGLQAIVAIHNLKRGPAIGGCRLIHYSSTNAALEDALRLGYMMSYKAAISNLNHGGAKAVLIKPAVIKDRKAYFEAFGDFVNELGGRYITAVDSGTTQSDMDIIANRTPFVTCTSASGTGADPSPETALGVRRGIEAAVKFKLNKDNLDGLHVTIQGAGHVGYYLAKELIALGSRITMCDVNQTRLQHCVDELGVQTCLPDDIYDVEADIFAPCALGAILNLETIKRLKVSIVAGSANNQLAHSKNGVNLHERGILYAPDFVINAGGLIYVAAIYEHANPAKGVQQVSDIYFTCMEIFERAAKENCATNKIAEQIAVERLR